MAKFHDWPILAYGRRGKCGDFFGRLGSTYSLPVRRPMSVQSASDFLSGGVSSNRRIALSCVGEWVLVA